ncbi:MAG: alpha/beta fold hydrolase [Planctomycetes bacterium]|nr:alpha/beta fold hydrolase [Planctomycetota bacterium]
MGKPVLLLHGWLGRPDSFGALPELLEADGHRVLPVFRAYNSRPRRKTLEDLADELEDALRAAKVPQNLDAPMVVVCHSMGGLVARTWIWRHYASKKKRPPVERLIECASPRHGVHLMGISRAAIKLGLVPGTALARQMSAPNPFLWDLAHAELIQQEFWPETVSLAGLTGRRTAMSWIAGGRESDGVVPAIFTNPNPVFLKPGVAPRRFDERVFVPFSGYRHHGPKGIIHHLRKKRGATAASPVGAFLRAGVAESPKAILAREGPGALEPLRRSIAILRFDPLDAARPHLELQDGKRTLELKPLAVHPEGLALFGWTMAEPGASLRLKFECNGSSFATVFDDESNCGEVFYAEMRPS